MKSISIFAQLVVGLVLVVACSSTESHPPLVGSTGGTGAGGAGGDSGTNGAVSAIPTTATPYELEVGATVAVAAGTEVGYFLTAPQSKSYVFRWTGDTNVGGGYHHFYGSLWTAGHFTSVTPGVCMPACPLEAGETVTQPIVVSGGERIDWDTDASSGYDGFSFTTDSEPVYIDALIDNARHPELVFFVAPTGAVASPTASPFAIPSIETSDAGVDSGTDAGHD